MRRARPRAVVQGGARAGRQEETLKSPCIQVCQMDPQRGLCLGCGRTLDEIARWSAMSEAEREAVLRQLAGRQAAAPARLS
ncbi:MAG TPA: DUF1289 domain-containing protein [Burkholderiales bacterium]|nr:DUF1289 domain-containing protein [Burkholderiales bacterium]